MDGRGGRRRRRAGPRRPASGFESAPERRRDELAAVSVVPNAPIPTTATSIASNPTVAATSGWRTSAARSSDEFDERGRVDPVMPGAEPFREDAGQVAGVARRVDGGRAARELDDVDRRVVAGRHRTHDAGDGGAPRDPDRLAGLEQAVDHVGPETGDGRAAGPGRRDEAATDREPLGDAAPSARSWAGASRNSIRTTPSARARSRSRATRKREIPIRDAISTLVSWRSKNRRATWPTRARVAGASSCS